MIGGKKSPVPNMKDRVLIFLKCNNFMHSTIGNSVKY
jgi:hypothetical protein